ncbi:MAG: iron-containing alcohol dehydrogenase [Microbacteriaceae bacterium]
MSAADAFLFRSPATVAFGVGASRRVGAAAAALGRRALIVTDEVIAGLDGFAAIRGALQQAGVDVAVVSDVESEAPTASLHRIVASAASQEADVVIGVGGGSCIDTAKLVALMLQHPADLPSLYGEALVPARGLPMIAVPTTAGTGSEVSPVAVVTDPERAMKVGISSEHLIPTVALVDPELTVACPRGVTIHSGLDALTHAVEAATTRRRGPDEMVASESLFNGATVLTDPLAHRAVALILANLRRAAAAPDDIDARVAVSEASLLAGLAFANAGTALAHALQYAIGARSHAPHGVGVALLLPHVMRYNQHHAAPAFHALCAAAGLPVSVSEPAAPLVDAVESLMADLAAPRTLAELGITHADLPDMATDAASIARLVKNNPRTPTVADLQGILGECLGGEPVGSATTQET